MHKASFMQQHKGDWTKHGRQFKNTLLKKKPPITFLFVQPKFFFSSDLKLNNIHFSNENCRAIIQDECKNTKNMLIYMVAFDIHKATKVDNNSMSCS